MHVVIASNLAALSTRLREVLLREGQTCATSDVVPLSRAPALVAEGSPDLVVVVLSPDPERALMVLRELRKITPGRLVVVGPGSDAKFILRTLREGADHYVDESNPEEEFEEFLARPKTGELSLPELGRVICVTAPSGGSGASTLAVNLAAVLARQHQRCALLDADLETEDLTALLDVKATHTLADLCRHATKMDRVMFERSLVRHDSGVSLLAAPPLLADVAHVTDQGIRQCLTVARALFPNVVVDLGHSVHPAKREALRWANQILLVFQLEFTSLRNVRRELERLGAQGIEAKRILLVANRCGQPKELSAAQVQECLGLQIAHYLPNEPETINQANNKGIPAVLDSPKAKVCKSFAQLAQRLFDTKVVAVSAGAINNYQLNPQLGLSV